MAFLEGLISGFGQGARETANNMLEAQLQKYRSSSKIWEAMAQDQNYHPSIRQKFWQNAQTLLGANPMQRGSVQAADAIIKTDPSKAAQEAFKAMEMLGVQPKYYNPQGYRGSEQQMQLEADTTLAKERAQLKALQERISLFQPGGGASGTDLERHLQGMQNNKLAMGPAGISPSIQHLQYVEWIDDNGQKQSGPGAFSHGKRFNAEGREILATGQLAPKQMVFGNQLLNVNPNEGTVGSLASRSPAVTTSTRQIDPVNLTTHTETVRSSGNVSLNGGSGQVAGGGGGQVIPPAPVNNPAPAPAPAPAPQQATFPGQYQPRPAEMKEAYGAVATRKLDAAERGNEHIGWILDAVEKYQRDFANPATGPIRGRINEFLNSVGWGDAINALNKKIAEVEPLYRDGQLSGEQVKSIIAPYEQRLDQLAQQVAAAGHKIGDTNAARQFAEIITLTRSLNGLELIAMSGSGNGITRLYQMMERALLNPHQDMSLLRGHADGLAKMFTAVQGNTYEKQGHSWATISPRHRKVLRRLGMAHHIPGYQYQEKDLTAEYEGSGRMRSYKQYAIHPETKQKLGSDDGGLTWYDAETGQPYRPQ